MRCVTINALGFPACGRCPKQRTCCQAYFTDTNTKVKRRLWDEGVRSTVEHPERHAKQLMLAKRRASGKCST